jgi:hypothetical protein
MAKSIKTLVLWTLLVITFSLKWFTCQDKKSAIF